MAKNFILQLLWPYVWTYVCIMVKTMARISPWMFVSKTTMYWQYYVYVINYGHNEPFYVSVKFVHFCHCPVIATSLQHTSFWLHQENSVQHPREAAAKAAREAAEAAAATAQAESQLLDVPSLECHPPSSPRTCLLEFSFWYACF